MSVTYRVSNTSRHVVLADQSGKASNPLSRGVGLIGKQGLPPGGGLIIQPCSSVVSFFMRFPIDVLFVDGDHEVLHLMHAMTPWRTSKIVRGSKLVVELPAGTLAASATQLGDRIDIERV